MTHWAASLIGKPWSPAGDGPDDFYCWGLVRHALFVGWGISVPVLHPGDALASIEKLKIELAWLRVLDAPRERDIVLLQSRARKWPHVGLMINDAHRLILLHADGFLSRDGPVGSVVAQPLRHAEEGGYAVTEIWRLPA